MSETVLSEPIWRAGRIRNVGPARRCRSCKRPLDGKSPVCRSRKCPEYSHTWAGDQRQKLFRNLEAFSGNVLISAVTAPGSDAMPWDETICSALGEHKQAGGLGCRVHSSISGRWNREAPPGWRRLHRRAYQETVRRHGPGSVVLLARVWELQARGLLHVHPCSDTREPCRWPALARNSHASRSSRRSTASGFVHSKRELVKAMPSQNVAAYLSSYFVKGRRGKTALWESVQSSAMPRSIIHVSVKLTMQTGCTMRALRLRRLLFVMWGVSLSGEELRLVCALMAKCARPEIVKRGNVDLHPVRGSPRALLT